MMSQDDLNEQAKLHSAGAIVRHISPFDDLVVHKNLEPPTAEFLRYWVVPLYMSIGSAEPHWKQLIVDRKSEIEERVPELLLGEFNWRPKKVGAYLAAVMNYDRFIDTIGVHLLKSEVCCVGGTYSAALAYFNTAISRQFLTRYLDYYLTKPELYFDQAQVMTNLKYLDSVNSSSISESYAEIFNEMQYARMKLEIESSEKMIPLMKSIKPNFSVEEYMDRVTNRKVILFNDLTIEAVTNQVEVITELAKL